MKEIIGVLILVLQGLVLGSMGYNALNWEYWLILILTICYALSFQLPDD